MNPLETLIRARITAGGPMPVSEFMALALGHPKYGYYNKGDPFGADGDFTTAPEISQVFGELIGLWAAVTWQQMGSPEKTILIECGPGRGTLMKDALRAAANVPIFAETIEIHLVETSETLRACQAKTLSAHRATWHNTIETIPEGPSILIANEFFDALPIRQFKKELGGWSERCIVLFDGALSFESHLLADEPFGLPQYTNVGDVYEICPMALTFVDQITARLVQQPGAALIIDYGYERAMPGDSLQAVRHHTFTDPLTDPGNADLTAHVNFGALAGIATHSGCTVFGPVRQATFLRALGILERTQTLLGNALPNQAGHIHAATQRLIDPLGMGSLFKVMTISHPGAASPAGFEKHPEKKGSQK